LHAIFFYHTTHDYFSFGALNEDAPAVKGGQNSAAWEEKNSIFFFYFVLHFFSSLFISLVSFVIFLAMIG
jgi:hypothetical protein